MTTPIYNTEHVPITRCPTCHFQHRAAPDTLCAICVARTAEGGRVLPSLLQPERSDEPMAPQTPNTTAPDADLVTTPETGEDTPRNAPPQGPAEPPPKRGRPSLASPSRHCAHEPCSAPLVAKRQKQKFCSVQCSVKARETQRHARPAAGTEPRARHGALKDAFLAHVQHACETYRAEIARLGEDITRTQNLLQRRQAQLVALEHYLTLEP